MADEELIQTKEQAEAAGERARLAGKARTSCPLRNYPFRTLRKAWLEGWDKAVKIQEILVRVPDVPMQHRATFWPQDREMPKTYVRPKPIPCPSCKRLLLDTGGQATIVKALVNGVAYFFCRAPGCNHKFKLPVQE